MIGQSLPWTNPSVLRLSKQGDPVEVITARARALVTEALDKGWKGPPFDPLALADLLSIVTIPRDDVPDARTIPGPDGRPTIEYNPTRPRGRMRYSLAHEIAHTFFSDWAERIRHRSPPHTRLVGDEWQMEALCNIAAAEIVMPIGSFHAVRDSPLNIDTLVREHKRYEVSMEALLIRTVRLRGDECAMFCASRIESGELAERYRLDYVIGSRLWNLANHSLSTVLPKKSVVSQCIAIGYSAKGVERWGHGLTPRVECVGIASYPGSKSPRVVGFLKSDDSSPARTDPKIEYLLGDATDPRGDGPRIIVQVVSDAALTWGGGGFAANLRRKWPKVQESFRRWTFAAKGKKGLGQVHFQEATDEITVASIVAQHGYGQSDSPRIRYRALMNGLESVASLAETTDASAHMPRIGCGIAGGDWDVVEEMLQLTLLKRRVSVFVYDKPNTSIPQQRPTTTRLF